MAVVWKSYQIADDSDENAIFQMVVFAKNEHTITESVVQTDEIEI